MNCRKEFTETEKAIIQYQTMGKPKEIRNLIALSCKPLINWALRDSGYMYDTRRDIEEMEQEAFILLLEAIDEYDSSKGAFSTYFRLKILNMNRKNEAYNLDVSLNSPVSDDFEEAELMDLIESEEAQKDFEDIETQEENKQVRAEVVKTLGQEIADIVFDKYGIKGQGKTLNELSKKYNIGKGKIQYIIQDARYKLSGNKRLQNIWNEYEKVKIIDTGSFIAFSGSKTNKINSVVESAVMRYLDLDEKIKNIRKKEIRRINLEYKIHR